MTPPVLLDSILHGDPAAQRRAMAKAITLLESTRADHRAEGDGGVASGELPADPLRRRAIGAARQSILKLRESEEIGDDAFHQLEEELDWAELSAQA